jgi:hypothetical protein
MRQLQPATAEWKAFLGLVPFLGQHSVPTVIHDRLRATVLRLSTETITRNELLLRAGLSFFDGSLDVDIALMRLLRDGTLAPVVDQPFTFRAVRTPKGTASCVPSPSKPAARSG